MTLTQEEQDRMLAEYLALQESTERAERADDDSEDEEEIFAPLLHGVLAHSQENGRLAFAGKADTDDFSFLSTGPVHWDPYNMTVSDIEKSPAGQPPPPSRMIAMKGTLGPKKVTLTLRLTAEPDLIVGPKPDDKKKPPPPTPASKPPAVAAAAAATVATATEDTNEDSAGDNPISAKQQCFGMVGWGQEEEIDEVGGPFAFQFTGDISRTEEELPVAEGGIQSTPVKGKITIQVGEDTRKKAAEVRTNGSANDGPGPKRPRVDPHPAETSKDT